MLTRTAALMTSVINSGSGPRYVRYVRAVEISQPLPGAEERTVRAARRFGRIGLLMTIAWLLVVPMSMTLTGWPPAGYTASLLALFVVALGLHVWRIRELTKSLGRRAS